MSCRETIMTTGRLLALALAALAGGCANPPPDISANYQVLYLPADAPGARPTAIVAPEACLQPDTTRTITLEFEKAGTIDVDAAVLDPAKLQMRMKMKMN